MMLYESVYVRENISLIFVLSAAHRNYGKGSPTLSLACFHLRAFLLMELLTMS